MKADIQKSGALSNFMLKLVIAVSLICPVFTSSTDSQYYPDFMLTNVFVLLFIIVLAVQKNFSFSQNRIYLCLILGGVILYNIVALYINTRYLGMYGSQINVTIAFLFFCALIASKKLDYFDNGKLIDFFIWAIVITNIIGIIVYLTGYNGISFLDGQIDLQEMNPDYYERRFNWIFLHKSQYAFILVLFLGLVVAYRDRFRNKITYISSIGVLMAGLVISHTYTSLIASLLIFAGLFLDFLRSKITAFKIKYLLFLLPIIIAGGLLLIFMLKERNLSTLGGRIPIWMESVNMLRQYPNGLGSALGLVGFDVPGISFQAFNCHNYFLNQMLCFSIPVGICFIFTFFIVLIFLFKQKVSFLTLGIWAALLIPLNMDYALTIVELPIVFFSMFCIFMKPYLNRADYIINREIS